MASPVAALQTVTREVRKLSAPAVRLIGALVAALVLLFAASPLSAQPMIQYVYDALGRLIAVVDQNGNVGVYNYDRPWPV